MRAVFCNLNDEVINAEIAITGDQAHHLQVVRVTPNEEILILNGKGSKYRSQIISITKKEIVLKILTIEKASPKHQLNLAIACPKKEAFFDIVKLSIELGIQKIIPITSDFSQYEFTPNERLSRIMESALVQSNNLFLPEISSQVTLDAFLNEAQTNLIYFSSKPQPVIFQQDKSLHAVILIGPEAGFSASEEEAILNSKGIQCIHMPTPILRAPTAVATSIGYMLHALS